MCSGRLMRKRNSASTCFSFSWCAEKCVAARPYLLPGNFRTDFPHFDFACCFLPMWHATETALERAQPFSLETALYGEYPAVDFFYAQILAFRHGAFGASTAILFCPALLFFPVILFRFFRERPETRRRLFPLLFLSLLAMLFSTRGHVLLSMLPVLDKFRWPFKVFIFADFFLLASLVVGVSAWATDRTVTRGRALGLYRRGMPHPGEGRARNWAFPFGAMTATPFRNGRCRARSIFWCPAWIPGLAARSLSPIELPESPKWPLSLPRLRHLFRLPRSWRLQPVRQSAATQRYALYTSISQRLSGHDHPRFQKDFEASRRSATGSSILIPLPVCTEAKKALPGLRQLDADPDRSHLRGHFGVPIGLCHDCSGAVPLRDELFGKLYSHSA